MMKRLVTLAGSAAVAALTVSFAASPVMSDATPRDCRGPSIEVLNIIADQRGTGFAGNLATNVNTNAGQGRSFGDPNNTGESVYVDANGTINGVDCFFRTNEDAGVDQSPQNPNLPPG
jgi:hypothetical protein